MKKKTIIIVSIIVLLLVIGLIVFFALRKDDNENTEPQEVLNPVEDSKTIKIYNKLKDSDKYQFTRKVDDDNQVVISKSGDRAYEEETFNGKKTYYIVSEGDLYLLNKNTQRYYKYQNNDEILQEIVNAFSEIEGTTYTDGKENINGQEYGYEQFRGIQGFLIDSSLYTDNITEAYTRFYYSGNNLKYIKTLAGDKEELLEIDIDYDVDDSLFEIPEGYSDGDNL